MWYNGTIGGGDQNHPKEKERQEGKVVACGGLTNNRGKKKVKGKGEKERETNWIQGSREEQGQIRRP